jgi:glutamate racemase
VKGSQPIGVFDSGVGGLSVLHAIRRLMPDEELIYVADSAHVPYGEQSSAYIQQRALTLTRFLLAQGVCAVVVACNTATAAAAGLLRATFAVPIVAMEPAVKPAVAATRTGVVGVLATTGTLQSATFAALLGRFAGGVTVVAQPCPGLVEQVEAGDLAGPATRALVEAYTAPLLAAGADTLVLGCTHYPFLRPLIAEVAGPQVTLVETGGAVARRLQQVLAEQAPAVAGPRPGCEQFYTSGNCAVVGPVMARLWGRHVEVAPLPSEFA